MHRLAKHRHHQPPRADTYPHQAEGLTHRGICNLHISLPAAVALARAPLSTRPDLESVDRWLAAHPESQGLVKVVLDEENCKGKSLE